MSEQQNQNTDVTKLSAQQQVEVTCPHCGKPFFHKVGSFFKKAGITVLEVGATILLSADGFGEDE